MRHILPVLVFLTVIVDESQGLISDVPNEKFIREINKMQSSWTAGMNFYPGSSAKNLLSTLPMRNESLPIRKVTIKKKITDVFDARTKWARCKTVGRIREQGNCASSWAMVAVAVFSDRQCIAKVGPGELSSQSVLGCCRTCGVSCLGGYVTEALAFLVRRGTSTRYCNPYEMFPCAKISGLHNCAPVRAFNPICRTFCKSNYSKRQAWLDMHRSSLAYSVGNTSDIIRSEIMARGPVVSVIDLYEDFLTYKSGVYSHVKGQLLAQHPVKVVGWGKDASTSYWLVLNTWGYSWGDKGVIKIAQDTNGVNLENRVFAVLGDDPFVPIVS